MLNTVKLKDVCEFKRGLTYSKKDEVDYSGNIVVRATNIDLKNNKLNLTQLKYIKESIKINEDKILKKGDILICTASGSKSHLGKVALIYKDIKMAFGGFMGVLRTSEKCLPKFLYNILISQKFKKVLLSNTSGANINNLRFSQIENFEFILPSLQEQQHIVGKLDAVFAEINNKEQLNLEKLNNINKFKKSILDNLLGNNLIKLNEACDLIKRGISPKYLETGGVAVINQKCIRNHIIDYSKARRHDIDLKKVPEERFIKKGDVLINSTGHGTLGRVAQVNQKPAEKTTVDSHVTIIRPKQKLFDLGYFANALIKIEKQLEAAAEGASGQTELSRSKLENEFSIPYMDSIDKQRKVSLIINSIFENIYILKNLTGKIIENLKSLKLSFLYKELHNKKI